MLIINNDIVHDILTMRRLLEHMGAAITAGARWKAPTTAFSPSA